MISPTGQGLRSDGAGDGRYGSLRSGSRRHLGADYLCTPGYAVLSPISGEVVRIAKPYANDDYSGLVIKGARMVVKLFYLQPIEGIVGQYAQIGSTIGYAQDISKRYNKEDTLPRDIMKPHIHLEIDSLDPEILITLLG